MVKKSLRVVSEGEREVVPLTLLEAVETGDVLEMLLAQRRLIAEALTSAAENTKPQFSNELNKLHSLIAAEERKRSAEAQEAGQHVDASDGNFDAAAI